MIQFLVSAQYEAGILRDIRKMPSLLERFPHSIIYFHIDSGMRESEWERYVRSIIADREKHRCSVGIVSYNENPALARKYLMDIGVDCGFVRLNLGFQESARILMRALDSAEAKGGRRYIRARVPEGKGNINLSIGGRIVPGELVDVSAVGLAAFLPNAYPVGAVLPDVQLRLWGSLVLLSARVEGVRVFNTKRLSVLLYQTPVLPQTRGKIFTFVRRVVQHEIDSL